MSIFDPLGQNISTIGQILGLPEMGISENRVGQTIEQGQQTVPYLYGSGGGAYLGPANAQYDYNQARSTPISSINVNPQVIPQPQPQPQPNGGGNVGGAQPDTELQQLLAMAQQGSLNPVQRSRLAEMLAPQVAQQQAQQQQEARQQLMREAENYYGPAMSSLEQTRQNLTNANAGDIQSITNRYSDLLGRIPGQEAESRRQIEDIGSGLGQNYQSAFEQAARNYNALNQQAMSRFGGGSSAGQAVGELANQEYLRQTGQLGQQQTKSQGQIGQSLIQLQDWVKNQHADLETQKTQALNDLEKQFRSQMSQVDYQQGQTEQAKAQLRIQVLQDTINQANNITSQSNQIRQNIVSAAMTQFSNVSGRSFTPAELEAYQQVALGNMPFSNLPQSIETAVNPSTLTGNPSLMTKKASTPLDELLNNLGNTNREAYYSTVPGQSQLRPQVTG